MKKPNLEKMRDDLIQFEIEEVYYSKDYQIIIEEDPENAWKSEEEIIEYFEKDEDIEDLWEELFNQYGDYD
jgi:hypothetical protein